MQQDLKAEFKKIILQSTRAQKIGSIEPIQELWSGYGKILRVELQGGEKQSVVVKYVRLHEKTNHPRGWNTNRSHLRKLKSYEVETYWYKNWSSRCDNLCKVPDCYVIQSVDEEVIMVFEDLDDTGYDKRKSNVGWTEIKSCLKWLANFHATYLGENSDGLWEIGTYWHLDTRPDELNDLSDLALKESANEIDKALNKSPFQTFVHGDAKLANFCFTKNGDAVAAVDFQYIGGGCGMKDVAYFIGSCLYEEDCERYEDQVLDYYFSELKTAVQAKQKNIDLKLLEKDWRKLYPLAWTDFHRFIKGWSPGHWKINSYSERIAREVIQQLKNKQEI